MTKEIEVTNVLNLQQNAVIIFSTSEDDLNQEGDGADPNHFPTIEFANIKSEELFNIKLDTLNARASLSREQFLPLLKSKAEVYETGSAVSQWALNAIRA